MNRLVVQVGVIFLMVGGIFVLLGFFQGWGKIPFLGKLPGDIYIQRKNFIFYFPLGTCILLSVVFTFILFLLRR